MLGLAASRFTFFLPPPESFSVVTSVLRNCDSYTASAPPEFAGCGHHLLVVRASLRVVGRHRADDSLGFTPHFLQLGTGANRGLRCLPAGEHGRSAAELVVSAQRVVVGGVDAEDDTQCLLPRCAQAVVVLEQWEARVVQHAVDELVRQQVQGVAGRGAEDDGLLVVLVRGRVVRTEDHDLAEVHTEVVPDVVLHVLESREGGAGVHDRDGHACLPDVDLRAVLGDPVRVLAGYEQRTSFLKNEEAPGVVSAGGVSGRKSGACGSCDEGHGVQLLVFWITWVIG